VKLGSWEQYLAMRSGIVRLNSEHRGLLSNDLGAVAGLLFDLGAGKYVASPSQEVSETSVSSWEFDLAAVRAESASNRKKRDQSNQGDVTHTEVQGWLRDLGLSLGFEIWIASNDRSRPYGSGKLGDRCLAQLPIHMTEKGLAEAISFIDVIWFKRGVASVVAAFEVEHTTSIYSGILRLLDLAHHDTGESLKSLYLVAPDNREHEVRLQLNRPAFQKISELHIKYLPYGELDRNRESMARFGEGLKAIEAISKNLS
jgi:type II restriction enzyme